MNHPDHWLNREETFIASIGEFDIVRDREGDYAVVFDRSLSADGYDWAMTYGHTHSPAKAYPFLIPHWQSFIDFIKAYEALSS